MDSNLLAAALRTKIEALQQKLLTKVEVNLTGDILNERSGTLRRSIDADFEAADDSLTAKLASTGVPYAAIQEHGGRTAPHEIVAVKARALSLAGAAGPGFARRVRHPGSSLPARSYLGSALEAMRTEIENGLKGAVRAALGAD